MPRNLQNCQSQPPACNTGAEFRRKVWNGGRKTEKLETDAKNEGLCLPNHPGNFDPNYVHSQLWDHWNQHKFGRRSQMFMQTLSANTSKWARDSGYNKLYLTLVLNPYSQGLHRKISRFFRNILIAPFRENFALLTKKYFYCGDRQLYYSYCSMGRVSTWNFQEERYSHVQNCNYQIM